MRIVFKIIAAPFVVILTVVWAFLVFLFSIAEGLLNIVCGIGVLVSIALFVMHNITGGILFLVLAFLVSPAGLPLVAEWLIDRIADLNNALKGFITA